MLYEVITSHVHGVYHKNNSPPAPCWMHRGLQVIRPGVVLLALLLVAPLPAAPLLLDSGARQVTLLELYTSQGCSSCPPAERWLNRLIDDGDLWKEIVPVAFHVDYS